MATELNKETANDDSRINFKQVNDMSTDGESREQSDKQIKIKTKANKNGKQVETEIDVFNFNEESQERPPWWTDEIGQLRKTFVVTRKLLKKERKKATKTADDLMLDMAFAAYQHDKIVLRTAVNQAKARYEQLGGKNSNVETTT